MKERLKSIYRWFAIKVAKANEKFDNYEKDDNRLLFALAVVYLPYSVIEFIAAISLTFRISFIGFLWVSFCIYMRIWWVKGKLRKHLNGELAESG